MKGFFSLKTAADLREKLRRDLARLEAEPLSVDAAFNFFVTAAHMVDWMCPDETEVGDNRAAQKEILKELVFLQVCSRLANGAKHFVALGKQNKSVSSTEEHGDWLPPGWQPDGWLPAGWLPEAQLVVYLDGEAAAKFGPIIGAIELAEKVMKHWAQQDLPS